MNNKTVWTGIASLVLTSSALAADLTVTVEGLKAPGGFLNVSLFANEAAWEGGTETAATARVEVNEENETLVFDDLAPGTYAIRLMHDENGNGKLDTKLFGIPKEGWGFSNNPRTMGPAKWAQAAFEIVNEGNAITINVR